MFNMDTLFALAGGVMKLVAFLMGAFIGVCLVGVSVDQVMKKFHISRGAATQRLATLAKQGYATRVGRGHYRAATP
jgi:hypothetical protein